MKLLLKIRLSWFFLIFLVLYSLLSWLLPHIELAGQAVALFSVNSFLYGFYISPILTGQKTRIDDLGKIIRAEANALFDILLKTKKLPRRSRNIIQDMVEDYIEASFKQRKPAEGEAEYEKLIGYCLGYKGQAPEAIDKIMTVLVANQQNRSQLAMQLNNKVYSNEWWIMMVLFSITIWFVLFLNTPNDMLNHVVKPLLCTGLSMLMVNLLKLSTLTHKKAKNLWKPLDTLKTSRFRRID
jgi:hypothetical protein